MISGTGVEITIPTTAKLNGLSSASLLIITTCPLFSPGVVISRRTVNVSDSSTARVWKRVFVITYPSGTITSDTVNGAVPSFVTVNVRDAPAAPCTMVPKSVASNVLAVPFPSMIDTPLPITVISGRGAEPDSMVPVVVTTPLQAPSSSFAREKYRWTPGDHASVETLKLQPFSPLSSAPNKESVPTSKIPLRSVSR